MNMEVQAREEMFVWSENLRCRGRCVSMSEQLRGVTAEMPEICSFWDLVSKLCALWLPKQQLCVCNETST